MRTLTLCLLLCSVACVTETKSGSDSRTRDTGSHSDPCRQASDSGDSAADTGGAGAPARDHTGDTTGTTTYTGCG